MHFEFLDIESVDFLSLFGAPEVSDQFLVIFIINIQFSAFIVFKLWVVDHFLRDSLSSEEPDTLNFKLGFVSEHQVSGQAVLSEVVDSLEETIQHVGSLVKNLSLTIVHLVV